LNRYFDTGEKRVIGKSRDVPVITKSGLEIMYTLKVITKLDKNTD